MVGLLTMLIVHQLMTPISANRNDSSCLEIQCSCCINGKCDFEATCDGCIDGITGLRCQEPCPDNCINCSQRYFENEAFKICHSCIPGFYKGTYKDLKDQPIQNDCSLPCAENCFACSQYNNCMHCKSDYYLTNNGTCEHCLPECKACIDKAKHFWTGTSCQRCSVNCISCTSNSECTKCDSGHYIENGVCLQCRQGCLSCDGTQKCSDCEKGFLLVGDDCQACQGGCENCALDKMNHFVCLKCKERFFLLNGTCRECSPGCLMCNSKYECEICDSGYMSYDRLCHKCPKSCINCNSVDRCLECNPTFYVSNGICNQCPKTCSSCSGKLFCEACYDGFWGKLCDEPCSEGCIGRKCNNITGECLEGCSVGVTGANCSTAPQSATTCSCITPSANVISASIVTSVVTVVVIAAVLCLCGICIYRKRKGRLPGFLQCKRRDTRGSSDSTSEGLRDTQEDLIKKGNRLSRTLEVIEDELPKPKLCLQPSSSLNDNVEETDEIFETDN